MCIPLYLKICIRVVKWTNTWMLFMDVEATSAGRIGWTSLLEQFVFPFWSHRKYELALIYHCESVMSLNIQLYTCLGSFFNINRLVLSTSREDVLNGRFSDDFWTSEKWSIEDVRFMVHWGRLFGRPKNLWTCLCW